MSTVGTISRIASNVAGRTVDAVTHPVRTAGSAAGRARHVAGHVTGHVTGSVIGGSRAVVASSRAVVGGSQRPGPREPGSRGPEPTATPRERFPEAPPPRTPRAQEPSATEPKAASRAAAHAGRTDEPTDDWRDELDELDDGPDVETPVGTTGAAPGINPHTGETNLQQPGTEPLMDPSLTKKAKAEAEMMKRASDTQHKKG